LHIASTRRILLVMSSPSEHFNLAPSAPELNMHETDVATIDSQIKKGLAYNNGSAFGFLNNFFSKLPHGSGRRLVIEAGMRHHVIKERDTSDESLDYLYSELFFDFSYADFYDEVDEAVEAAGLDIDQLEQMQISNNFSLEDLDAISEHVMPVYRILRTMGYSHADLWS